MKIKGPDGQLYEFPDDAKDTEIEQFFNESPEAQPKIVPTPYEQYRLEHPTQPMMPWGPAHPEEALIPLEVAGAAARRTQQVMEPVATAATDLARDFMRQWGMTPPPAGEGLWQGPWPTPIGFALGKVAPDYGKAIDVAAGKLAGTLTEPGTMLMAPFGATKAGLGFFTAGVGAALPEQYEALIQPQTGPEALERAIELGGTAAFGGLLGRGLLGRRPVTPIEREVQRATEERIIEEGRKPEYPGTEEERVSAEAGRGYRPEPAAGLEKETQVLLEPGIENNRSLGLGHEVEQVDSFPNDAASRHVFRADPAVVDKEGNFVRPGKIVMSRAAFELWLRQTAPELRESALRSMLAEEGIHSITTKARAAGYYDTLTSAEVALGKKLYLGDAAEQAAGFDPASPDYKARWGFELLRQRMQRLMRMDTSEAAEVAGKERWSRRSLEIISDLIRNLRELFGTKAAKAGQEITRAMLDRAEANIKAASTTAEAVHPETGIEYGGEQPFGLRRKVRGYDFDPEISDRDVQVTVSKFSLPDGRSLSYVQTDGIVGGENVWSLNPELMREAGHDIPTSVDILANVPPGRYRLDAIRQMMPERPDLPEQKAGTVRLYHGEGAAEGAGFGTSWFTKDWARAASYGDKISYVDVPEEVAADAQARAREAGSGTSSDHLLDADQSKRARDLPERLQPRVFDVGPAALRRKAPEASVDLYRKTLELLAKYGRYSAEEVERYTELVRTEGLESQRLTPESIKRDYLLARAADLVSKSQDMEFGQAYDSIAKEWKGIDLEKWIKENEPLIERPQQMQLFGLRRKRPEAGPELPLGPIGPGRLTRPETAPAAEALGPAEAVKVEPMTQRGLSESSQLYLSTAESPSFKDFEGTMRAKFGDIRPGQLRDVWMDEVWNYLMNARGADLSALARDLGLAKKANVETAEGGLKVIPDPVGPPTPVAPTAEPRPYLTPTELGIWVPTRERVKPAAPEVRVTTPQERFRHRVIAAIGEKLIQETEPGRKFLSRKTVEPEEIADPRIETKEPVYNHITTADQADVANLGRVLTEDARAYGGEKTVQVVGGKPVTLRKRGFPVSVTKRLTAIQNLKDGRVSLVSTFRDGRRGAVLLDPQAPGATHSTLESILRRYRVVASVLLDEPVKSFRQDYKGMSEYEGDFGQPARRTAEARQGYQPPPTAEEVVPRRTWELTKPLVEEEARGIMDSIIDEVGEFREPEDVLLAIEALRAKPKGPAISAISKMANQIQEQFPDLGTEEVLNRVAKNIYDDWSQAQSWEEFQQRAVARGPAPSGPPAGLGIPARPPAFPRPGAPREIVIPRTHGPTWEPGLRRGPGPEAALPPPERPRMMTPEEAEFVGREAERKYPRRITYDRPVELTEEQIKAGEPEGPQIEEGTGPAGLRRQREALEENSARVLKEIWASLKRRDPDEMLSYTRDVADNIGNDEGARSEQYVRGVTQKGFAERGVPTRLYKLATGEAKPLGDPEVLRGANPLIAAGSIQPVYKWTPKLRAMLTGLISKNPQYKRAQAMMASTNPADQALGNRLMRELRRDGIRVLINTGNLPAEAPNYAFDPASKSMLKDFRAQVQQGIVKANQLFQRGTGLAAKINSFRAKAWLKGAEDLLKELDYADRNWGDPNLVETATRARRELDRRYDRERAAGYDVRYDSDYMPGRYEAELFSDNAIVFGHKPGILGRLFRRPRTFDNYYHAISVGPYIAATRDIASIVGHRARQGERLIQYKAWTDILMNVMDPDTGKPIVMEGVRRADGKLASPEAGYEPMVIRKGYDQLFVKQEFRNIIKNLTTTSTLHDSNVPRFILEWGQRLKHTLLLGDSFHLARLGYYATSIMGTKAGYRGGLTVLEFRPEQMAEAVKNGVLRQKDVDWAMTKIPVKLGGQRINMTRVDLMKEFERQGLNIGRIQDAIYKDLVSNWPVIGTFNKWLFDKFTRGLMMQSALVEFERLHKANPNVQVEGLMRDISKDLNNYFGSIGRQGWIKNPTLQDLSRIAFLAPQWVEGLIMKETTAAARVGGLAARPFGYRKGLPAMGVMGRGIAQGLMFMILLTQMINLVTRRKPTWKNDEPGHKWDAWIPSVGEEGEGFWFSPLAVFNEVTHDLVRLTESKGDAVSAAVQIGHNKLSPWGRAALVFATGITPTRKVTTTWPGRLQATAAQLLPVPISFGKIGQYAGHQIAPGIVPPTQRGAVQRQALASIGLKIEPADEPALAISKLASEYMRKEHGREEKFRILEAYEPSTYPKLRNALRAKDYATAKKLLDEISKKTNDRQIIKAMKLSARHPFTGAKKTERDFLESLTPAQADLYSRAVEQKEKEYQDFLEWFSKQ